MNALEIKGFKHVTITGIARLFQTLDSYGTVGLLFEIPMESMLSMLMDTEHFGYEAYVTNVLKIDRNSPDYDKAYVEIHDELVDAYTMVIWGFSHLQDDVTTKERSIANLSSALELPVVEWDYRAITIEALEEYCAEHTVAEQVHVRLSAYGNGHSYQRFEWIIGEAEEFHAFKTMYEAIKEVYENVLIQIV